MLTSSVSSHAMEEDNIQSWWEIPSIVHFCEVFSPICPDLLPIDINVFEQAIELNSGLLTNLAVRFVKICGFYDSNSLEWWNVMKQLFKNKCSEYNFEYSLDSVTYFDYLTRKQKVEALYILCHFMLDVKNFQDKISARPQMWNKLNVKPIGFDLNNSLYWYFGSTRLYREDFENTVDLSTYSSMSNDTMQLESFVSSNNNTISSSNDSCDNLPSKLSAFGSCRKGKWHVICNNNESWHSLADITEHSKNINIRSLHRSVCKIIQKLPQIKRNKAHYKYLKSPQLNFQHSIHTRSLRSMHVNKAEYNEISTSSEVYINEQFLPNVNLSKSYGVSLTYLPNKRENYSSIYDQNHTVSYSTDNYKDLKVEKSTYETKRNLRSNISSTKNYSINVKKDDPNSSKIKPNILKYDDLLNIERCDQENNQKFGSFKQKLRTSKRFKTETNMPPFKDLNC